ncbi:MAG: response regulator [Polyangiaceae bacterium]|nr:response regulator [Polyangiaceae bacterium]
MDDDRAVLAAVERALAFHGFVLTACSDPLAALALIERCPLRFSVVVTDLDMPAMSGLELADSIRKRAPLVRVLLYSGSLDLGDTSGRVDAYLPKPSGIAVLADRVKELLAAPPHAGA